ncbi:enolase C-terminal domain-like protein [Halorubrum gandharaense]
MRRRDFSLRLDSPLSTARAEILDREGVVLQLDPGADPVPKPGIGEATPLPGWTETQEACTAAIDRAEREGVEAAMAGLEDAPAARHGLSVAFFDAEARAEGEPLAHTLAAERDLPEPAERVPVNATIGDGSSKANAKTARRAVDDGHRAVKVKIGARPLEADLERVRAIRRAVGPAVEIRADANGGWDRGTARRALDALADLDVAYVEQPLPANDLPGLARLREESRVAIAADESLAEHGLDAVLDAEAADFVILKPMVLGGPDRALDAAMRAREANVEPVVTTTVDAVVARTAAVHVAAAIPHVRACGLATGELLAEDLAPDPCPVEDGDVEVPTEAGLAGERFDGIVNEE